MRWLQDFIELIFPDNSPWEAVVLLREVTLLDGTKAAGPLMMRTVRGRKDYRRWTAEEAEQHLRDTAW